MPEVCESVPTADAVKLPSHRERRKPRRQLWIAALIGGAALAGAWFGGLNHWVLPKRFAVVEPGRIYRSGQISRWAIGRVLDRHRIQLIIDLNGEDPCDRDQLAELQAANARGIEVKRFRLRGNGTGDIRNYAAAVTEMYRARRDRKRVLIHCHAGSNRTGAAVAFYRLLVQQRDPDEVYQEMKSFYPELTPTGRLVSYMNANMRALAELLVESGVLRRMPERIPRLGQ